MRKTNQITYNIPRGTGFDSTSISGFKGLQLSDNPLSVDPNSSLDMKNVYLNDSGALSTRPRIEYEKSYISSNNDYYYYGASTATSMAMDEIISYTILNDYINIVQAEKSNVILLIIERTINGTIRRDIVKNETDITISTSKVTSFLKNDKIYILNGSSYLVIKPTTDLTTAICNFEMFNIINDEETYIPTLEIKTVGESISIDSEKNNTLTNFVKNSFFWDGEKSLEDIYSKTSVVSVENNYYGESVLTTDINSEIDSNNYFNRVLADGRLYLLKDSFNHSLYKIVEDGLKLESTRIISSKYFIDISSNGQYLLLGNVENSIGVLNHTEVYVYNLLTDQLVSTLSLSDFEVSDMKTMRIGNDGSIFAIEYYTSLNTIIKLTYISLDKMKYFKYSLTPSDKVRTTFSVNDIRIDLDNNVCIFFLQYLENDITQKVKIVKASFNSTEFTILCNYDTDQYNYIVDHRFNQFSNISKFVSNKDLYNSNVIRVGEIIEDSVKFYSYIIPEKISLNSSISFMYNNDVYFTGFDSSVNKNGLFYYNTLTEKLVKLYDFLDITDNYISPIWYHIYPPNKRLYRIFLIEEDSENYIRIRSSFYQSSVSPKITLTSVDFLYEEPIINFTKYIKFNNNYWFYGNSNKLWYTTNNDPTYIGEHNYIDVGDSKRVTGLLVISDNILMAFKEDKIFIIQTNILENDTLYTCTEVKGDVGNIPVGQALITKHSEVPLMIDDSGVYTIKQLTNVTLSEHTTQSISFNMDKKFIKEINKDKIITHNYLYWTYLIFPGTTAKVYVLDNRTFEWYYWELPEGNIVSIWNTTETIDGLLYQISQYITKEGNVYSLRTTDKLNQIDFTNSNEYYTSYNDILFDDEVGIEWFWESQILPLNLTKYSKGYSALGYSKVLYETNFLFTDSDADDEFSLKYSFKAYRKMLSDAGTKSTNGTLNYIRSVTQRTYIPRFSFLQVKLENNEFNNDYQTNIPNHNNKLNLIQLKFKYKLMEEIK